MRPTKLKHPRLVVSRDYKRIRGEKTFRLPAYERGPAVGQTEPNPHFRDVYDNNPGLTPSAPNPDDL